MYRTIGLAFDPPSTLINETGTTELQSDAYSVEMVNLIKELILERGLRPVEIEGVRALGALLASNIAGAIDGIVNLASGIPAAFRLAHSPMLLEMLKIPYSGADPFVTLLCRDKAWCKQVAERLGVEVPTGIAVTAETAHLCSDLDQSMYPLIMKPNFEGSSLGVTSASVIANPEELDVRFHQLLCSYPAGVLLERFIPGAEITVMVVGNGASVESIPMILAEKSGRLPPNSFIYHHELKESNWETCEYLWTPVDTLLSAALSAEATSQACRLFKGLGLRDMARFDFRYSNDGRLVFIEANSHPVLDQGNTINERINSIVLRQRHGIEQRFLSAALSRMGFCD